VQRDLASLFDREHDVLVVGGGIHGAAAAWDAAQRGLAVALVEAADFGSGTSWNSLKTIHGGLRHLQRADVPALRESVRERRALLRIAPAIVRPLAFVVPAYGHGLKGREALAVAVRLNDLLSRDRNQGLREDRQLPRGRVLSRPQVLGLVPGLSPQGITGGIEWTDAQVESSERLVMGFLHAAAEAGATLANRAEVEALARSPARVTGARVRDVETGEVGEVRARLVLNAAGPGIDPLLERTGLPPRRIPLLSAWNLVLRRPVAKERAVGASGEGRFLFLVPWRDRAMVGTGYAAPGEADAAIRAFRADASRAFPWAGLEDADVSLVHRGLVPGTGGDALWTRSRLVDHEAEDGVGGLVSMIGVKYTTARGLAEKAVDLALRRLGRRGPPCRTHVTELPAARLLEGTLAERTRWAVRVEMARSLGDAVLRRLDLGTAGRPEAASLDAVAAIMAEELRWTPERLAEERQSLEEVWHG
jgi:glycerol-3-phosphate dehydrogenase